MTLLKLIIDPKENNLGKRMVFPNGWEVTTVVKQTQTSPKMETTSIFSRAGILQR